MINLAIFDLDGTLINSIEDLADATNYALDKCGFPTHPVEKYNYFVGDGVNNLLLRSIPKEYHSEETIQKVKNIYSEYYSEHYYDKTYIYDGILPLLKNLKDKGIKLAIASNKPDEFTKVIISKLFGTEVFNYVQGNKANIPHKPEPQIIYQVMNSLCVEKSQVVMIGDTDVDIRTGKNAGIYTIGCLWGFRERTELEKAGADYIVSTPEAIENIINNI